MDHSWGRNVLAQGLGDLGYTLAARLGPFFPANSWIGNRLFEDVVLIVRLPLDPTTQPYNFIERARAGPGNFPYGFDVVPDELL